MLLHLSPLSLPYSRGHISFPVSLASISLPHFPLSSMTSRSYKAKMSECRFCLTPDVPSNLISPCHCKGSVQFIHQACLQNWLRERFRRQYRNLVKRTAAGGTGLKCELCHSEFHGELASAPLWQRMKTVCSSQTSYYIALNIPVIIYLLYKFHKVFSRLLSHFQHELISLMCLGGNKSRLLSLIRFYLRFLCNSVPVAVFGCALPLFVYNTVTLLKVLSLECKEFKIKSNACTLIE